MNVAYVALGVVAAGGLAGMWISARRFERRRIARGEWDAAGPTHPTKTPRNEIQNRFGNGLAFDLQHGLDREKDWPGGRKPGRADGPEGKQG